MKLLKNKIFLLSSLLFTINQILEKGFGIFIPFIHAYLDDLLCMPVVLTLTLFILRWIIKSPDYTFSKKQVIFALLYFSFAFEVLLPLYSEKYTADVFDVLAYGIGAVIFYKYINKEQSVLNRSFTQRKSTNHL
ncbi:MAG: magnesium citrate secondary transporter [Bacteroidetes bacterium]|nr:magnesium citrate secondary transporter [Bacteroidota bacterium]